MNNLKGKDIMAVGLTMFAIFFGSRQLDLSALFGENDRRGMVPGILFLLHCRYRCFHDRDFRYHSKQRSFHDWYSQQIGEKDGNRW